MIQALHQRIVSLDVGHKSYILVKISRKILKTLSEFYKIEESQTLIWKQKCSGFESWRLKLRRVFLDLHFRNPYSITLALLFEQCTVVEGAEKSQNDFFAFSGRFGYGKTNGLGIFH